MRSVKRQLNHARCTWRFNLVPVFCPDPRLSRHPGTPCPGATALTANLRPSKRSRCRRPATTTRTHLRVKKTGPLPVYHLCIHVCIHPHSPNDRCFHPGINLPEGVDPSFLAALPEDIRREVLQNQLGIRPPSRPPVTSSLPSSTTPVLSGPGVTEVSPEFLAALPPAIQEEVRETF